MFGLGVTEIVVIMVIALIFLGPKKLPGLAKGLGKGMKNFQDALRGIETEINKPDEEEEKPLPAVPIDDDDLIADSGYQDHSEEEMEHHQEEYYDHEAEHAEMERALQESQKELEQQKKEKEVKKEK